MTNPLPPLPTKFCDEGFDYYFAAHIDPWIAAAQERIDELEATQRTFGVLQHELMTRAESAEAQRDSAVPALSTDALMAIATLRRQFGKRMVCCGNLLDGHPGDGFMQPPDGPRCCEQPEEDVGMLLDVIAAELARQRMTALDYFIADVEASEKRSDSAEASRPNDPKD